MSAEGLTEDRTLWLAIRQTLVAEWRDDYSVVSIVDALNATAERILADRLAVVQAERDAALSEAVEWSIKAGRLSAQRDAALAALDRVKALADAAEACEAMSLSRTFDGGSFGAWVDAAALRAAVEGGRS